ncbi:uncharacterized protein LOC135483733 [Lineus longissimus]|uniref:uncharacterized protein LOC135483733 n=1 Tax=Lineus longissimus TaxID=88925 RepID=UPI00315D7B08
MTHFPPRHYPDAVSPCEKMRDIFVDYSNMGGTEFYEDSSSWQSQKSRQVERLRAKTPSLPLIPPNEVPFPFRDICSDEIRAFRRQLHRDVDYGKRVEKINKSNRDKESFRIANSVDIEKELDSRGIDAFVRKYWKNRGKPSHRFLTVFELIKSKSFLKAKYFPRVNSQYCGGCLGYTPSSNGNDTGTVFYPSGPELTHLTVRNMSILQDSCKAGPVLHDEDLKSPLCGMLTSRCQGRDFLCLRSAHECMFYEVEREDDGIKLVEVAGGLTEERFSSVVPSPYIPGEALVATSERKVSLMNDQKSVSVIEYHAPRFTCNDPWLQAYYGTTPRSFVLTDRTSVQMADMRCSKSKSLDIFALPFSKVYTKERIMVSSPCAKTFYHLVATDYTLMLMDERFPQVPVMLWRPSVRTPPQYLQFIPNITQDQQEDLIIVGCQDARDVLCYPVTLGNSERPLPHGLGPPWRLSCIDDFAQFPGVRGCGANTVALDHRLTKTSIIGVRGIPFNNLEGFTALQLSACGDLFYQNYRPGHPGDERTCGAGPGSIDIKLAPEVRTSCQQWSSQLQELNDRTAETRTENIPHREIDVTDMFTAINKNAYPHLGCFLCTQAASKRPEADVMVTEDDYCLACGLDLKITKPLQDYSEKGNASLMNMREFDQKLYDSVVGLDVEKFTDPYSQLLLKQWNEDDEIQDHLKERDKLTVELKKNRMEEKKRQKLAENKNAEFKLPLSPLASRQLASPRSVASRVSGTPESCGSIASHVSGAPVNPGSVASHVSRTSVSRGLASRASRTPGSDSISSNRSVRSNGSSQKSYASGTQRKKRIGTFQRMSFQLENSMKGLLEYDKSPKRKQERIAGFDSLQQSPRRCRRSRSSDAVSVMSNMSLSSSNFVGTAQGIESSIKRIIDYESDAGDECSAKNRDIQNWVSAIDASSSFDSSQKGATIIQSGQTTSRHILGDEFVSPACGTLKLDHSPPAGDPSHKDRHDEFCKVGESFDNLSIGSAMLSSLAESDIHESISQPRTLCDQPSENINDPMDSVDPDMLTFSQATEMNMFSQSSSTSVKTTPKSANKGKKKALISGF